LVALPTLVPPKANAKIFGDVAWHIGPEAVPVLTVDVTRTAIYFEHHTLLWKHPQVKVAMKNACGGKRVVAGVQVFIAEARGPGMIALSRDGPGRIVAIEMPLGRELEVREHQFVASTEKLCYSAFQVKSPSNLLHGGHGYFIDKFASSKAIGVVWVYAYGSVFEAKLAANESIDIEAGAWLYKEPTVRVDTIVDRLAGGPFGGHMNMIVNRFTGPGRVGVQSMRAHNRSEA
jgi:uncharacterized protein (AIM24 family)